MQHYHELSHCKISNRLNLCTFSLGGTGLDFDRGTHPRASIWKQVRVFCDDRVNNAIDSQVSHLSICLKRSYNEVYICSLESLQRQDSIQHGTLAQDSIQDQL